MGSAGAPAIGGVAPAAYVDAGGNGVPVAMPDESMLSGGTPFWPTGADADEDGDELVTVGDVEPLLPVDVEPGEAVVEEGAVEGDDEEDEPECVLVVTLAARSTWRR